ncbi:MAG: transporter [Chitinophagaceae bacterium]|nr:transporter [Chitinophagaceae bacterium]
MRILICVILFSIHSGYILACDLCSCSGGSNHFGILPNHKKNFVGFRFQMKQFHTSAHHLDQESYGSSDEYFYSAEIIGRWVPIKRVQLFTILPYQWNQRRENNIHTQVQGIGDINVLANYQLIQADDGTEKRINHALQAGVGIKCPTGKYDQIQNRILLNQNIQLGSGSWDIPMNVIYTLKYKQTGLNAELHYKRNGVNPQHYRFGDRFTSTIRLFTSKKVKQLNILPHIGGSFERATYDVRNQVIEDFTGGNMILLNAGTDLYLKSFGFNLYVFQPVRSTFGDSHIQGRTRISTSLIYLF